MFLSDAFVLILALGQSAGRPAPQVSPKGKCPVQHHMIYSNYYKETKVLYIIYCILKWWVKEMVCLGSPPSLPLFCLEIAASFLLSQSYSFLLWTKNLQAFKLLCSQNSIILYQETLMYCVFPTPSSWV